tara:strand:+ start:68304 stop:68744 length:441 start_codon:yes stop_codon:yes gene_type:complete
MKKGIFLLLLTSFSVLSAMAQSKMKIPKKALQRLENFKEEVKFEEDLFLEYPGISDELFKPELTKLINLAADDFIEVTKEALPTKEKYQKKIEEGLQRFSEIYPDINQKDIDRICSYYKELMRYVNLRSASGWIIKFQRGIGFQRN